MKKSERELIRMARNCGWEKVRFEPGTPHGRIIGIANGKEVECVVSLSKSLATSHSIRATKRNFVKAFEATRQRGG